MIVSRYIFAFSQRRFVICFLNRFDEETDELWSDPFLLKRMTQLITDPPSVIHPNHLIICCLFCVRCMTRAMKAGAEEDRDEDESTGVCSTLELSGRD